MSAVVLAAGRATRMGEEKLLLRLGDKPVIRHVVETVGRAGMLETLVVVNPRNRDAIADALPEPSARLVCNQRFHEGIATSIAAGAAAVSAGSQAMLLVQGDQPLVTTSMLLALVEAWRVDGPEFVAASYDGLTTTPVLFARDLYPELQALEGDVGARAILRQHVGMTLEFPAWTGSDLDTKADYEALRKTWSARGRVVG